MKPNFTLAAAVSILCAARIQAAPEVPVKTSFAISGIECGACLFIVQDALTRTAGVAEVEIVYTRDYFARVTFDPEKLTEHQLAQAVRDAPPLHGKPYLASLKLRIPGISETENAAKLQALFRQWEKWVTLVVSDAAKGEMEVEFQPLEEDQLVPKPLGWTLKLLVDAIQSPAPQGLGLKVEVLE